MLRKFLKFAHLMLLGCVFWTLSAVPARAEIQDWLPDFGKWAEKGLKPFFDLVYENVAWVGKFITDGIKTAVDGIIEFFQFVWSKVCEFFKSIIDLLCGFFEWLYCSFTEWYEWMAGAFRELMEWLKQAFEQIWVKLMETVEWAGNMIFEVMIDMFDWFVGLVIEFVEWLIDELPEIDMPGGFDEGMNWALEMGRAFDQILPVTETLAWLTVYLSVVLTVMVYRIIKSFIPGIST